MKKIKIFFTDFLKEKGKWSQGRIYLLLSIIVYYLVLGILTFKGMHCVTMIDLNSFKIIIDALQWAMGIFATYAFGGKGIDLIKELLSKKNNKENDQTPTDQG